MTLDLRFVSARSTEPGDALDLLFNAAATPPGGGGGTDPLPGGAPTLRSHVRARWSNRADAAERASVVSRWGAGGATLLASTRARWSATERQALGHVRARWGSTEAHATTLRSRWGSTEAASSVLRARWQATTVLQPRTWRAPWQGGTPTTVLVRAPWQGGVATAAAVRAPWGRGAPISAMVRAPWQGGTPVGVLVRAPWQGGTPVWSWGGPWTPPHLLEPPPENCRTDDPGDALHLVLRSPAMPGLDLVFACYRPAVVAVPVRRVYVVTNTLSLTRVSDGAPIPCERIELSLDEDSWAWRFTANIPGAAIPLIEPSAPGASVELQATVNGTPLRVLVESIESTQVFASHTATISGRGKSALLDTPEAVQVFSNAGGALTSQQLVDQALPSGWACDWGLTAWLVPAGVWSHQGTPMTAAVAVAAAGGGYVQPHDTAQEIRILPRYPVGPWDWVSVTPDYSLPFSVARQVAISWVERPRYNRVFVAGSTTGGVLAQVTRDGTAGDIVAPMIVDALTTHVDAGRQRGLSVLARTGRQAMVTLALPVLPATGILRPGHFVEYSHAGSTRRGYVRGVAVSATHAEVWQQVSVETNEG